MEVKAINNSVSQLGFEGRKAKSSNPDKQLNNEYQQMDAPASRKTVNAMRNAVMAMIAAGALGSTAASCSKDDFISAKAVSAADAQAHVCYKPINPDPIHDTIKIVYRDTVEVPGPEKHIIDSIPYPVEVHDTVYVEKPGKTDTIYQDRVDTVYKYITERDTIINTIVKPVIVKEAPWHLMDSLIAQGRNIGIPLDGPVPKQTNNNVLFIGSTAYNEYDYKLYETQLDAIGTNAEELSLVTKVTDLYEGEANKKVSYLKTRVVDVPGVGIKLERFVMGPEDTRRYGFGNGDSPKSTHFGWQYAGYEIRTNNRDGRSNKVLAFDKYGQPLNGRQGEYIKGADMGSFLYGTYLYDDNGNPYTDDSGKPEKAFYDFSKGKMWSSEVEKVETTDEWTWG